jgi:hypothetical protein
MAGEVSVAGPGMGHGGENYRAITRQCRRRDVDPAGKGWGQAGPQHLGQAAFEFGNHRLSRVIINQIGPANWSGKLVRQIGPANWSGITAAAFSR